MLSSPISSTSQISECTTTATQVSPPLGPLNKPSNQLNQIQNQKIIWSNDKNILNFKSNPQADQTIINSQVGDILQEAITNIPKQEGEIIQEEQGIVRNMIYNKQSHFAYSSNNNNNNYNTASFGQQRTSSYATTPQEDLISISLAKQKELSSSESNRTLDLLFVIDYECNQPGYEIIEFPIVVIDLKKQKIIDQFHTYVKPTISTRINSYISKITGIVQKDVMYAPSFEQVLQKAEAFLSKYQDYEGCILYDCDSDCQYLKSEFINKKCLPKNPLFLTYINLRNVFPLEISGGVINKSLSHAQQILSMEFQGKKHRGIDDARNQALVCIELLKRGFQFTSFMIQPQFIKQEPKQCVKSNLFNLYEYNSHFLLIKLEAEKQNNSTQEQTPKGQYDHYKKYVKFTCFLTVKKEEPVSAIHRVKDSTFYFDFTTSQASGTGLPQASSNLKETNHNILNNSSFNNSNIQNYQHPHNPHHSQMQHKNQIQQHESAFSTSFSAYLAKFGIERNKTALVLLGFDKNEFGSFQKSANLSQPDKELFFHDKIIYIDHNLVSFSGFLEYFKAKDIQVVQPGNQRKSSFSASTPHKIRKSSISDDSTAARNDTYQIIHKADQKIIQPATGQTEHKRKRSTHEPITNEKNISNPQINTLNNVTSMSNCNGMNGLTHGMSFPEMHGQPVQLPSGIDSTQPFTNEQIIQYLENDDFCMNFINFILVNQRKLQEYQDLAYHWQYINNKPQ